MGTEAVCAADICTAPGFSVPIPDDVSRMLSIHQLLSWSFAQSPLVSRPVLGPG